MASRPPLGIALQGALGMDPVFSQQIVQGDTPPQPGLSRGQIIAGILADMIAGATGKPGQFAEMLGQQRQQQQQDVQWSRRRQGQQQDWQAQEDYKRAHPDPSPMERDALAWQQMSPELHAAYREAQAAKPQFIPDGMGGGRWASPPVSGPPPAVPFPGVTFTPIPDGGPTLPASGGFRRY